MLRSLDVSKDKIIIILKNAFYFKHISLILKTKLNIYIHLGFSKNTATRGLRYPWVFLNGK